MIGARIEQNGCHMHTRQKITDTKKIDEYLQPLFQFKFETLLDTQDYMKQMWAMTQSYLNSALELFNDLQAKSTKNTISSLQLITTIGVVAAILVSRQRRFKFTVVVFLFLLLLAHDLTLSTSPFLAYTKTKIPH